MNNLATLDVVFAKSCLKSRLPKMLSLATMCPTRIASRPPHGSQSAPATTPAPGGSATIDEFHAKDQLALQQYATHSDANPFPPHTGEGGRFGLELTFTNEDMVKTAVCVISLFSC